MPLFFYAVSIEVQQGQIPFVLNIYRIQEQLADSDFFFKVAVLDELYEDANLVVYIVVQAKAVELGCIDGNLLQATLHAVALSLIEGIDAIVLERVEQSCSFKHWIYLFTRPMISVVSFPEYSMPAGAIYWFCDCLLRQPTTVKPRSRAASMSRIFILLKAIDYFLSRKGGGD